MKKSAYQIAAVIGLALVLVIGVLVPTAIAANGSKTVHVTGTEVPLDSVGIKYQVKGDLVGIWDTLTAIPTTTKPTLVVVVGTERFEGCIDRRGDGKCGRHDLYGTLTFDYIYWANYDTAGKLIKGQCTHPVTGGTGDLAGSRGVINMYDTLVGSVVKTTYKGDVELNAVPSEKSAADPAAAAEAAASAETATAAVTTSAHGCSGE